MNKLRFIGAGCNGPDLFAAVNKAVYSPSRGTVPAGATWPFVGTCFYLKREKGSSSGVASTGHYVRWFGQLLY